MKKETNDTLMEITAATMVVSLVLGLGLSCMMFAPGASFSDLDVYVLLTPCAVFGISLYIYLGRFADEFNKEKGGSIFGSGMPWDL